MNKTVKINGKDVPIIKATDVETTIKNKKTGEIYKSEQEWKSKGHARIYGRKGWWSSESGGLEW